MSDYTKSTNFTAKDTAHDTILGADFDTELSAVQNMSTTKANKVSSPTTDNIAKLTGTGDVADSGVATANVADVSNTVIFQKDAVFDAVVATSGGTGTIDFSAGNKQTRTQTANGTLTFTAPGGPCSLVLKVLNSGGSRTITWPATVKWPGGVTPTPSATSKYDVYSFFYDGTNYWGAAALNYT